MIAMPFPWIDKFRGKGESDEDPTAPPAAPSWYVMVPVSAVIRFIKLLFAKLKK